LLIRFDGKKMVLPFFLTTSIDFMNDNNEVVMKLIKLKDVMDITGLGRSTIYKYITEATFPKPVSLGKKSVAWVEGEVQEWVMERIEARDGEP
jgi:prophage regulatory protein